MDNSFRILGLDPGLVRTGWGMIDVASGRMKVVAAGVIAPDSKQAMTARLICLHQELTAIIATYQPGSAAAETIFVNRNPASALKLGQARGVILLASAQAGLKVAEYAPNLIKKSLVGTGHASKEQIIIMIRHLLPGLPPMGTDAADALAVAVCHANHSTTQAAWIKQAKGRGPNIKNRMPAL